MLKIFLLTIGVVLSSSVVAATDIYLFRLDNQNEFISLISSGQDGYNNQPSFSLDSKSLFFTSDRNAKQMDIFLYDLESNTTRNLTQSLNQNEFSARPIGSDSYSFILQEGVPHMSLWQQNFDKTYVTRLLKNYLPAAYYAIGQRGVLFWARYASALYYEPDEVDVGYGSGEQLFAVGNAGTSLHIIPGSDLFSFVHKQGDGTHVIKSYNPNDKSIASIASLLPNNDEYCWSPAGMIFRVNGTVLEQFGVATNHQWASLGELDAKGFKRGSRCSVSPDGTTIAVVNNR